MKSLTVIRPRSLPAGVDQRQLLHLVRGQQRRARPPWLTPTGAVTSGIGVITAVTGRPWSVSNRMSRLVTMPSRTPSALVTGTPEMR